MKCSTGQNTGGQPPHTNRGVVNYNTLTNVSVDWLTVSIGNKQADRFRAYTVLSQPGYPSEGFARSERRIFDGGKCWRRWDPNQEMNGHGYAYESWVFSGPVATPASKLLLHADTTRPSRLDVAFDFSCHADYTSDQVIDETWDHFTRKRITCGISGHAGIHTRYIGSRTSERMIRIYRKDKQDEAYASLYGPTMRIELVLKGKHAAAIWDSARTKGVDTIYSVAAAHLEDMTGIAAFPTIDDVPEIVHVAATDQGGRLATNIMQNASWIVMCAELGIDVNELARMHMLNSTPQAISRMDKRKKEVQQQGVDQVRSIARQIIQHH